MRILHLVISLDMGGLEVMVCDLANAQALRGHEVYFGFVEHPGTLAERVKPVAVWHGDLAQRGRRRTAWSLVRFVRQKRIDMIHSHNAKPHLFAVMAHLITGVPVVHTKHGRNEPDVPRLVLLNRILAWFSRSIVAVSENVAELARTLEKTNARKVVTIPNGIDVTAWRHDPQMTQIAADVAYNAAGGLMLGMGINHKEHKEHKADALQERRGLTSNVFCIGTVGRLSPEKNHALLLRAVARIADEHMRLLIVGDGRERAGLEVLANALGVADCVAFVGMQSDTLPFYQQMDVFCLSSSTEGTPMTLLEAGACGLPAVVTNVGGCGEVVLDGVSGLVVPVNDEVALAEALVKLRVDGGMRVRMGTAARARIRERYGIEAMVDAYERVYGV